MTKTENNFGYLLYDVTRQLRKHFDRRATRLELTRAQWHALKSIRRNEGLSQKDVAEYLDMEPIAIGRVLDRLEKTGFIERRADPADRRRWSLYLLPKAHAVVDEMEIIASELRDDAMRGVGRDDFETLLRVLTQFKDNLAALDVAAIEERGKS